MYVPRREDVLEEALSMTQHATFLLYRSKATYKRNEHAYRIAKLSQTKQLSHILLTLTYTKINITTYAIP